MVFRSPGAVKVLFCLFQTIPQCLSSFMVFVSINLNAFLKEKKKLFCVIYCILSVWELVIPQ